MVKTTKVPGYCLEWKLHVSEISAIHETFKHVFCAIITFNQLFVALHFTDYSN